MENDVENHRLAGKGFECVLKKRDLVAQISV
jgi:hypothetical protein